MLLKEMLEDEHEKGHASGLAEGEQRAARLFSLLMEQGRTDDMAQAVQDADFREKLFKEFNL